MRDALRGHVDLLVLAGLEDGPRHGYGLVEALRERSAGIFDLAEGTLYPALYRLERRGFVSSAWQTTGGRRRRIYRLTTGGRSALEAQRADWRSFSQAMEAVVA
jgi:transcriptional regulator